MSLFDGIADCIRASRLRTELDFLGLAVRRLVMLAAAGLLQSGAAGVAATCGALLLLGGILAVFACNWLRRGRIAEGGPLHESV